jgi:hypothetical protein
MLSYNDTLLKKTTTLRNDTKMMIKLERDILLENEFFFLFFIEACPKKEYHKTHILKENECILILFCKYAVIVMKFEKTCIKNDTSIIQTDENILKLNSNYLHFFHCSLFIQNSKSTAKNHLKENECIFLIEDIILQMGSYNETI